MLMITRTWDIFFDIFIGTIADRTRTRWGKFRPYLLWMSLPFGISQGGKLVYAYITLSLMMVVYSAINIPYSALMGVISPDSQERTSRPPGDSLSLFSAVWWCNSGLCASSRFR